MEPQSEPARTVWSFPFTPQDWEQTPPAVQAYLRPVRDELGQLQERVETLEARLCKLIEQYHDRQDDAGRFARRLLREMNSLWVFLTQCDVEPTNNRAERALRFGVL
jgi:hypothetical protein